MSATQEKLIWLDTSPKSSPEVANPHRSFEFRCHDLKIQIYTSFVDSSKWVASFYPELSKTVTLNAADLEYAKLEALSRVAQNLYLLRQQLSDAIFAQSSVLPTQS